jgi:hypothetical protein
MPSKSATEFFHCLWYAIDFENDELNGEFPVQLLIPDRTQNLIEGVVHEITEVTITVVIASLIGWRPDYVANSRIKTIEAEFKSDFESVTIPHLLTEYSIPYYGVQYTKMLFYESFLKKSLKNGWIIPNKRNTHIS